LIPIVNKPISPYVLEDLVKAGVKEVAIALGDIYPRKVKEYYGDRSTSLNGFDEREPKNRKRRN